MRHDPRPLRLQPPEDEADLVSLRELASRLWRGRVTILLAGLLAAAAAFLVTARLPDRYTATARVMFAAEKPNVIDLEAILSDPAFSKDTLQNEVEVLRSTSLLDRVADELALATDPEFNPLLRPEGALAAWRARLAPPTGSRASRSASRPRTTPSPRPTPPSASAASSPPPSSTRSPFGRSTAPASSRSPSPRAARPPPPRSPTPSPGSISSTSW